MQSDNTLVHLTNGIEAQCLAYMHECRTRRSSSAHATAASTTGKERWSVDLHPWYVPEKLAAEVLYC